MFELLKENEVLEIKSDRLFHDLFNENEMDTIEWTVMQILNCSYEDIHGKVTVGNTRLSSISLEDKQKYVDLIVHYNDEIIIIELNNNATINYLRNVFYSMTALLNSYTSKDNYYNKKVRCILVNLDWFSSEKSKLALKGKSEVIYGYPIIGKENEDYLIKIINVNLEYYQKICYDKTKKEDNLWKLFGIKNKEELQELTSNNKLLNNYQNKLKRLSLDKEYCRMIWDEKIEQNINNHVEYMNGYAEGEEQGIEQSIKIINMYNNSFTIEDISKKLKLPVESVQRVISLYNEEKL